MNIFESLENLNVSEECFNDIMSIVEEIINEVSVKRWKEAAINSLADRGFEEGKMDAAIDAINKKKRHSYKDDEKLNKHFNAIDRTIHAKEVAHLPNSKMSANKVLKAARKAKSLRHKQSYEEFKKWNNNVGDSSTFNRACKLNDRRIHAGDLLPVQKEL